MRLFVCFFYFFEGCSKPVAIFDNEEAAITWKNETERGPDETPDYDEYTLNELQSWLS